MNSHKTEVEIVHTAYDSLWQHMHTKRLFKPSYSSPKQAPRASVGKPSHKHILPSL